MLHALCVGIVAGASLTHLLGQLHVLWPLCLVTGICLVVLGIRARKHSQATLTDAALSHPARAQAAMTNATLVYPILHTCLKLFNLLLAFLFAVMLSMCWTVYQAQLRLDDNLDSVHENVVTRLTFRITALVQDQGGSQRVEARVLEPVPAGVPRHIQVILQDQRGAVLAPASAKFLPVQFLPGQVYRAALILKRPHGATNPHGFDYEGLMFQRNIRAIGKVRGIPKLLADAPFATFGVAVARVRHHLREAMRRALGTARYAPVMIALALGDQDSVASEDWEVFNKTGVTHLVSISGSLKH